MLRRVFIALLTVLLIGAMLPAAVSADHDEGPSRVYFAETGHTLQSGFLAHWRHHGAIPILGYPISEEFKNPENGLITQYFERAVMEWHPDEPAPWQALLYRLGADMTARRANEKPFQRLPEASNERCTYYQETGHFSCNGFRDYWNRYGGLPTFGYPISEEFTENGRTVQYYERARFEWHPEHVGTVYEVLLGRLGADAAARDKVDTRSVPQPEGVPTYDPGLWKVPPPPAPPEPPAPPPVDVPVGAPSWAAYWIEVDLSEQYLTAWEYDVRVLETWVSTGMAGYETPTGQFSVFTKLRYDDMTSGQFVDPSEYYYVEDVPHVMYFAAGGYAIHGVYWHSSFGVPRSHGCVGAPLWAAEWLYNWAPYGTTVWIHW